jgi:hypothetical protein
MKFEIDYNAAQSIARSWLKDLLETIQHNEAQYHVHSEDLKEYKKITKAAKRLLKYIG